MWKMTTGAGAINFEQVRRIRIQKAHWFFKDKDYNCAVIAEGYDFNYDFEFFDDEKTAQAYVDKLIEEFNQEQVLKNARITNKISC